VFSLETGTTNLHIRMRCSSAILGDNVLNFGLKHQIKHKPNYLASGDVPPSNGLIPPLTSLTEILLYTPLLERVFICR
jgi:hypothetical protein